MQTAAAVLKTYCTFAATTTHPPLLLTAVLLLALVAVVLALVLAVLALVPTPVAVEPLVLRVDVCVAVPVLLADDALVVPGKPLEVVGPDVVATPVIPPP
jgi:hypothetical protein